jgi:hypothetical protein
VDAIDCLAENAAPRRRRWRFLVVVGVALGLAAAFARNPWFSFSQLASAAALARRLGVPAPRAPAPAR